MPAENDELKDYLRLAVARGFESRKDMARNASEVCFEDAAGPRVQAQVEAALDEALAAHEREARGWPAVTDCDRLDAAFEELNARGIMARHNWTCCGNCGAAEMPAEFDRLEGAWQGVPIVGYTFYHVQDTESAAAGDGVCLNYGSTVGADSEAVYESQCLLIARTVCEVLTSHGLKVDWDGTYAQRIGVSLDWKRRKRPARFCGE